MARAKHPPIKRDWLGKSLAGLLLGFTLALALSGLAGLLRPGLDGAEAQLLMWMVPPVWVAVLGGVFMFPDGWRAWAWLSLANLVAWGLLTTCLHWG